MTDDQASIEHSAIFTEHSPPCEIEILNRKTKSIVSYIHQIIIFRVRIGIKFKLNLAQNPDLSNSLCQLFHFV